MVGMAPSLSRIANKFSESFISRRTGILREKRTSFSRKQHILPRKKTLLQGGEAKLYGQMRRNWRNM